MILHTGNASVPRSSDPERLEDHDGAHHPLQRNRAELSEAEVVAEEPGSPLQEGLEPLGRDPALEAQERGLEVGDPLERGFGLVE